jgi:hypothetical protein
MIVAGGSEDRDEEGKGKALAPISATLSKLQLQGATSTSYFNIPRAF